jgi:hypothetical protein
MISTGANDPKYSNWHEMENPGQLRGTLAIENDLPVLYSGKVGYDVTLQGIDLKKVISLVGREVVVTTVRIQRAGMIAPPLGHIVISGIEAA